jgi:hypothetical protein
MSSSGEGDRAAESLEVKGAVGWETSQIRTGRRATWQAVANGRTVEASKLLTRVKRIAGHWECRATVPLVKAYVDIPFWNLRMLGA